jgi:hypothetical protein
MARMDGCFGAGWDEVEKDTGRDGGLGHWHGQGDDWCAACASQPVSQHHGQSASSGEKGLGMLGSADIDDCRMCVCVVSIGCLWNGILLIWGQCVLRCIGMDMK